MEKPCDQVFFRVDGLWCVSRSFLRSIAREEQKTIDFPFEEGLTWTFANEVSVCDREKSPGSKSARGRDFVRRLLKNETVLGLKTFEDCSGRVSVCEVCWTSRCPGKSIVGLSGQDIVILVLRWQVGGCSDRLEYDISTFYCKIGHHPPTFVNKEVPRLPPYAIVCSTGRHELVNLHSYLVSKLTLSLLRLDTRSFPRTEEYSVCE